MSSKKRTLDNFSEKRWLYVIAYVSNLRDINKATFKKTIQLIKSFEGKIPSDIDKYNFDMMFAFAFIDKHNFYVSLIANNHNITNLVPFEEIQNYLEKSINDKEIMNNLTTLRQEVMKKQSCIKKVGKLNISIEEKYLVSPEHHFYETARNNDKNDSINSKTYSRR